MNNVVVVVILSVVTWETSGEEGAGSLVCVVGSLFDGSGMWFEKIYLKRFNAPHHLSQEAEKAAVKIHEYRKHRFNLLKIIW